MKLGIGLFILSILVSFVLLNPSIKNKTMGYFLNRNKLILSQLEMQGPNGEIYKVLKVSNRKGLGVEVYKNMDGSPVLLSAVQLTDKKDAFYKFDDKKHNLFLKDINEDGVDDIILPSIDKNMKARLNVFTFDFVNETLTKVTQH